MSEKIDKQRIAYSVERIVKSEKRQHITYTLSAKRYALNKGVTLVELVVVIGVFLAMIVVLTPVVQWVRQRSHKINCANNLMRLSLGLHMYALDHNDSFPPDLKTLYPDYVSDEKVFDCPVSKAQGTKDKPDYNYTPGLTESSPAKEIVVEDAENNHNRSGRNILRVNGSIEWLGSRR